MDLYLGFIILEGLLALAVVGTNLLVCAALCLHRELRSVTNCLVACLALADLGVGALAIPFSVVLSLELTLCFYTCLFLACFPLVTTQFSILLLLLIALNAHLKIRLPSSYAVHVRKGRVLGAVGLCWLLSLLIGLSPMMGWNRLGHYVEGNWTLATSFTSERAALVLIARDQPYGGFLSKVYPGARGAPPYSQLHDDHLGHCSFTSVFAPEYLVYFVFCACTLLPLGALLGIYADLFRLVRGHFVAQPLQAAKRGELHMARTLLLLLGIFCLCWIPLHVVYCVQLLCPGCRSYAALDRLAVLLSHLNSLANPLVYAMRKKDFGRALRSVLLRYVPCCSGTKVQPKGRTGQR
ncbi:adenosine receptor A1-like [Gopherus flavomarginatus]|uniref:adenosine receptor A1-like n=1 Tax=Gopherus flavomarginatus TaxID=286002 RepID=UPI0021CC36C1|nr:adenosine receptor A1-like [Gopherus flavomarginatus]